MDKNISALDVAKYIIELAEEIGEPVTNMKLQKLLYYTYAWYLVENDKKKLFEEPIMAWKYGPVVISVYEAYKSYGADSIKEAIDGDAGKLDAATKEIIEDVFNIYAGLNAIELANLTHSERPWMETFDGTNIHTISDELMYDFYLAKRERVSLQNTDEE